MAAAYLLLGAAVAGAESRRSVFLEDLTWTELRDEIASGKTAVIVPIGGTEQSGPAMALGKHDARVRGLSQKIALALGNTLVAPVIAYVPEGDLAPATGHMRFPGTITVPDEVFEQVLEYAARSLKLAGFRDVLFLGDHGGYQSDLQRVAERLNREWAGSPARAYAVEEYYRAADREFARALQRNGFSEAEIGTHAGLADTSLMLAVDPSFVRLDRLRAGARFGPADGVYGDPRRSTAELGQLGVDIIVARTVEAVRADLSRR